MRSHACDVRLTLSAVLGIGSKSEAVKPSMGLGFREGRAVLKPKCQLPLGWAAGQAWQRGEGEAVHTPPWSLWAQETGQRSRQPPPDRAFFSPF